MMSWHPSPRDACSRGPPFLVEDAPCSPLGVVTTPCHWPWPPPTLPHPAIKAPSPLTPLHTTSPTSPTPSKDAEPPCPAASRWQARHARGHREVAEGGRAHPRRPSPPSWLHHVPFLLLALTRASIFPRSARARHHRCSSEKHPRTENPPGARLLQEEKLLEALLAASTLRTPAQSPPSTAAAGKPSPPLLFPCRPIPPSACVRGREGDDPERALHGLHGHVGHAMAWPTRGPLHFLFLLFFHTPPG
jgi:hypothetical protein